MSSQSDNLVSSYFVSHTLQHPSGSIGSVCFNRIRLFQQASNVSIGSVCFNRIRLFQQDPSVSIGSVWINRTCLFQQGPSVSIGSACFNRIRLFQWDPSVSIGSACFNRYRMFQQDPCKLKLVFLLRWVQVGRTPESSYRFIACSDVQSDNVNGLSSLTINNVARNISKLY